MRRDFWLVVDLGVLHWRLQVKVLRVIVVGITGTRVFYVLVKFTAVALFFREKQFRRRFHPLRKIAVAVVLRSIVTQRHSG